MRLDLDCHVDCVDGAFGELADVVIDPSTRRLMHLVVQPHHRHELARLVPIGKTHAGERSTGGVSLDCTITELNELVPLEGSEYLRLGEQPEEDPGSDIGIEEISQMPPSQSLGVDALGGGMGPLDVDPHVTVSYDRVPKGMVEIRRESEVTSADGYFVGHVIALVLDDQERIVQLVVEHGHFWGKREITIPANSIDRLCSDQVLLTLPKDEVGR